MFKLPRFLRKPTIHEMAVEQFDTTQREYMQAQANCEHWEATSLMLRDRMMRLNAIIHPTSDEPHATMKDFEAFRENLLRGPKVSV